MSGQENTFLCINMFYLQICNVLHCIENRIKVARAHKIGVKSTYLK